MPKYKEIADKIRDKIMTHEYPIGTKLPYEYVLCVNYHCNKETMKKALDILVKEGLIIRRRGAGTFIKDISLDDKPNSIFNRSLTKRFETSKVSSDVIEFEVIPCDEFLAGKLQIEIGDFVYHIIRNRYVDGKPYLIDISYIPLNQIPNLKIQILKGSIYDYISKELNLKLQSCHVSISSALSTSLEQDFLGLKENEPYIQEEQVAYLSNNTIFEYTLSRYHYAHYEFQTIFVNG